MGHHASHGFCQIDGVNARAPGSDNSVPVLPPMPEQAAPADVEMAAEEPEEEDVLGDAQVMFGKKEKDLTEGK